jgi:DNA topoisomerase-2
MNVEDYTWFEEQRLQVLECTAMYAQSKNRNFWETDVLNVNDENELEVEGIQTDTPKALERSIWEIISNAADNVKKTRVMIQQKKLTQRQIKNTEYDVGEITVDVNDDTVIVTNSGLAFPIVKKGNFWLPEVMFGKLNSSSNYGKTKSGIGVNGLGVKLCNIFSNYFKVIIQDPVRHLQYTQVWHNQMEVCDAPEIEQYDGTRSLVYVEYKLKFDFFGYDATDVYTDDMKKLFFKICFDVSFTIKVPVIFNGHNITSMRANEYAGAYFKNLEILTHEYVSLINNESMEIVLVDDSNAKVVSFVNGMITREHGNHVEAVYNSLKNYIDMINLSIKELKSDAKKKLTRKDLKNHLSMIINFHIDNPQMSGQAKSMYEGPTASFEIPEAKIKKLMKWDVTRRLQGVIYSKFDRENSKFDGQQVEHIKDDKGIDATYAGKKGGHYCTLYIVEGDSAMSMAITMLDFLPEGKRYNGIFPMRGKPVNPADKSEEKVRKNKELTVLIKYIGIKNGVDYTDDNNYRQLRYQRIVILTDADVDGIHITGLVYNIFHKRFRSLLMRPQFVWRMRTRIISAVKGKKNPQIKAFYCISEYLQWKDEIPENESKKWVLSYKKGLGTNTRREIEEDVNNSRMINVVFDEDADNKLIMAFSKKTTNDRKKWMSEYDPNIIPELDGDQNISNFFDEEYKGYCIYSLGRAIPKLLDGLKVVQRKILWTAFKEWGSSGRWNASVYKDDTKFMKLAQFGSYVANTTEYHHGEKSVEEAIICMARDFCGTNNLPYFTQQGSFGTRAGYKAAQARYLFIKPIWWLPLVFKDEDMSILEIEEDEGKQIEPKFFLPIIPMILINGATGIATGYSTEIPNHHVWDIIDWLFKRLQGEKDPIMPDPWYRRFTGEIEIKKKENGKITMNTIGTFEIENEGGDIMVTEIPVKTSLKDYREEMEKLRDRGFIEDVEDLSDSETPRFRITGLQGSNFENLRLNKISGISNLVVLDEYSRPIMFNNTTILMEEFYKQRLPFYEIRRQKQISLIKERIETLNLKIKFIEAVMQRKIKWENEKKDFVYKQMDEYTPRLPHSFLSEIKFYNCTKESILESLNEIKEETERYNKYLQSTPESLWIEDLQIFLDDYSEEKLNELSGSDYKGYNGQFKKSEEKKRRRRVKK